MLPTCTWGRDRASVSSPTRHHWDAGHAHPRSQGNPQKPCSLGSDPGKDNTSRSSELQPTVEDRPDVSRKHWLTVMHSLQQQCEAGEGKCRPPSQVPSLQLLVTRAPTYTALSSLSMAGGSFPPQPLLRSGFTLSSFPVCGPGLRGHSSHCEESGTLLSLSPASGPPAVW